MPFTAVMSRARIGALGAIFVAVAMALVMLLGGSAYAAPGDTPVGGKQLTGKGKIVNLGPGADPLPDVYAKTWLVANMDTGDIYAAKGPHVLRAPASTIKTLTALAVMPELDATAKVRAKKKAANIYGSRVGLKRGKAYSVTDLYYAMLLPSANDAAIALAQANGGVATTVKQMNDIAASLGALDTVAKNTSGLDAPGQVSSAYDLAVIGREAMKLDTFAEIVTTKKYAFPYKKGTRDIYNTNRLVTQNYKGALGVKTGFTTNAGRTFIGAAERKGTRLIVVGMGIKELSATAAEKLLGWAFANKDSVTPIGTLNASVTTTSADVLVDPVAEESTVNADIQAAPTQTSTAGPSGSDLDDSLAVAWTIFFVAAITFLLFMLRAGMRKRRNRGRLANFGRVKLEN
jgi:serine-type D-Ala-D-Ala carboxypeptidase (penicillin-binding protein 5/6)